VVHDVPSAPVVVQVEHRIEHVAVRKMEALVEVGPLEQNTQNKRRKLKLSTKESYELKCCGRLTPDGGPMRIGGPLEGGPGGGAPYCCCPGGGPGGGGPRIWLEGGGP